MKKIYTAIYKVDDKVWLRFISKNMEQEFDSLEEIKSEIKKQKIKNAKEYMIFEHQVKLIERY